jgi:hypothetical protein
MHRQDGRLDTSLRQRKKVEMLFAHLKRILKLDRLRLRGRTWEILLAAPAQDGSSPGSLHARPQAGRRPSNNLILPARRVDFFNEIGPKPWGLPGVLPRSTPYRSFAYGGRSVP